MLRLQHQRAWIEESGSHDTRLERFAKEKILPRDKVYGLTPAEGYAGLSEIQGKSRTGEAIG